MRGLGLAPLLFGEDARLLSLGQGAVHRVEVGGGERLRAFAGWVGLGRSGCADVDDLLVGGVGGELALGVLQLLADLGHALFEEIAGVGGSFVAPLQIGLDEVLLTGLAIVAAR